MTKNNTKRREEGRFHNRLLIKKLVTFDDLFVRWEPYTEWTTGHSVTSYQHPGELLSRDPRDISTQISVFCAAELRDRTSYLKVWPHKEIADLIFQHTINVANDTLNFKIIQGSRDGYALVVCSHSQIIGGPWVAEIKLDGIPNPPEDQQP